MQDRLLALAALITPPDAKPTLAYLERRAKLTRGMLKDCVRRQSVSKAVIQGLLKAAPALGIEGLTADWLLLTNDDAPQQRGDRSRLDGGAAARRPGRHVGDVEVPYELTSTDRGSTSGKGTRTAVPPGISDPEADVMRHAQAQLVSEAIGRVVDRHEVVGVELRKVLIRMAAGLDALNHHEAASEIYVLLVKLNDMEIGKKTKGGPP